MEMDLRGLRQGERTEAEYEREFTRLLHCVPFVVRDDEDKARIFESGLRPSIFRFVQSSNLQTYSEVVNRALIVERGAMVVRERQEGLAKEKGKRAATEGAGQTHSGRPPRQSRGQSQSQRRNSSVQHGGSDRSRATSCMICGGRHYPRRFSQREGRCYLCGQEGHFQSDCQRGPVPAPSSASAPVLLGPSQGMPSAHYQAGRPPVQRQTEGSRRAPIEPMYAAHTEVATAVEIVATDIGLL